MFSEAAKQLSPQSWLKKKKASWRRIKKCLSFFKITDDAKLIMKNVSRLVLLIGAVLLAALVLGKTPGREGFYNVVPTEAIDPAFYSYNEDPFAYFDPASGQMTARVGDLFGVDLNCNNVGQADLVWWIAHNNPHLLHQYVYRWDPSVNVYNPNHAPRVLKQLLRNLPEQHRFLPIVRKCFPRDVRVA
jgi:hypothetical protein